jgi:hypothetical protein
VYPGAIHLNCLLGQPLAVWCSSSGDVHVWECQAPGSSEHLLPGFSAADEGAMLRYLGAGHEGSIDGAQVRTYATLERDGLVWVSPGIATANSCPSLGSGATYCREYVVAMPSDTFLEAAKEDGFIQEQPLVLRSDEFAAAETALVLVQPLTSASTCAHLLITAPGRRIPDAWRMKAASAALKTTIANWQTRREPMRREGAHA